MSSIGTHIPVFVFLGKDNNKEVANINQIVCVKRATIGFPKIPVLQVSLSNGHIFSLEKEHPSYSFFDDIYQNAIGVSKD